MSQHDYVINDQTTPAFRADLNLALGAIATNNLGTSAPSTTYAGQLWMDTTTSTLKIRDASNANWVIVGEIDAPNSRFKLISDSLKAASAGGIDIYNSSGVKIIDLAVASEATAKAGTNNTELMTPLRVAQAAPIPAGMIIPYGGASAPAEWLLCHGQSLSTTTYSVLHAASAYTYGGSGSTFSVPDLRGRVVSGQDDMGGTSANRLTSPINGDTLGAVGGTESHTLTTAEMPAHDHDQLIYTGSGNSSAAASYPSGADDAGNNNRRDTTNATDTQSISNTGGGGAHANVQPTIVLNYLIKT